MISKKDINCCKNEARKYIKNMKELGDNAGWVRLLLWYINELENKTKELGKGQQSLIQSRRKWKRRYYKIKRKNKELQEAVEQIYDDYQDIGKIAFDYADLSDQLIDTLKIINQNDEEQVNEMKKRIQKIDKIVKNISIEKVVKEIEKEGREENDTNEMQILWGGI